MPDLHPTPGHANWLDLTVPDAERVRDFYAAVVGWTFQPVEMGGYSDFSMFAPGGEAPVTGICHALGENADLPPVWLVYFTVSDVDSAVARCTAGGGTVLRPPGEASEWGRMAVIRDPAGAVCALLEPPADAE